MKVAGLRSGCHWCGVLVDNAPPHLRPISCLISSAWIQQWGHFNTAGHKCPLSPQASDCGANLYFKEPPFKGQTCITFFFFFFVLKENTLNSYLKKWPRQPDNNPTHHYGKTRSEKTKCKRWRLSFFCSTMAGCRYNAIHALIVFPTLYNVCI